MVKMAVLGVEGTWGLLSVPEKGFLGEMSFGAVRSQFKFLLRPLNIAWDVLDSVKGVVSHKYTVILSLREVPI